METEVTFRRCGFPSRSIVLVRYPCLRVGVIRPQPVDAGPGEIEILDHELPDRHRLPVPPVKELEFRVTVKAVPPFRCMEERVGIPDVRPRYPDDPGKDPGTGMRGKADHQVPDQDSSLEVIE